MRWILTFAAAMMSLGCQGTHLFRGERAVCRIEGDACAAHGHRRTVVDHCEDESPCDVCEPSTSATCVECAPACAKGAPAVEVRGPREIVVQAPRQKVIVKSPCVPQCTQPSSIPPSTPASIPAPTPSSIPTMQSVPQNLVMTPQAFVSQPQMQMVPQMAPQMAAPMMTMSSAPQRARAALGIDWVKLPLPIPRLYAVPTPPEFNVSVAAPQMQMMAAPVQMAPAAIAVAQPQMQMQMQSVMVPTQPALASIAPNPPQAMIVQSMPQAPAPAFTPASVPQQPAMDCRIVCTPANGAPGAPASPSSTPCPGAAPSSTGAAAPQANNVEELQRQILQLEATLQRMGKR